MTKNLPSAKYVNCLAPPPLNVSLKLCINLVNVKTSHESLFIKMLAGVNLLNPLSNSAKLRYFLLKLICSSGRTGQCSRLTFLDRLHVLTY